MENDYNNFNKEIIQKLLSQLNIKLNKQNKLIELGKKNLEKYKREIDEKLFEKDFKGFFKNIFFFWGWRINFYLKDKIYIFNYILLYFFFIFA